MTKSLLQRIGEKIMAWLPQQKNYSMTIQDRLNKLYEKSQRIQKENRRIVGNSQNYSYRELNSIL